MKILAVQNYGIGGTTLLHSLLDGHPELLTLPALSLMEYYEFWKKYGHLDKEEIIQEHLYQFRYLFEPHPFSDGLGLNQLGDNLDQDITIDKTLYLSNLKTMLPKNFTRANFLVSIFSAYNQTINKDINKANWLVFPIHCRPAQFAKELCMDFDIVNFIHMFREPIQNIGSLTKHINYHHHWAEVLNALSASIHQIFGDFTVHCGGFKAHGFVPYLIKEGVKTKFLKLEDLHTTPKESLLKLCDWLNIEWDNCLLQSTFNSFKWFNRPESIRTNGTGDKIIAQKHENFFSEFDKERLKSIIGILNEYYPTPNRKSFNFLRFLWPFKYEMNLGFYYPQAKNILKKNPKLTKFEKILLPFTLLYVWIKGYVSIRKGILKVRKY